MKYLERYLLITALAGAVIAIGLAMFGPPEALKGDASQALSPTNTPAPLYTEEQVTGLVRNWPLAERESDAQFTYDTIGVLLRKLQRERCASPVGQLEWSAKVLGQGRWQVDGTFDCKGQPDKTSWVFLEDPPRLLPLSGFGASIRLRAN